MTEIPPGELDTTFVILSEIPKKDGGEYEPDSSTSFRKSIEGYLGQQQNEYSVIESRKFPKHRKVLNKRT